MHTIIMCHLTEPDKFVVLNCAGEIIGRINNPNTLTITKTIVAIPLEEYYPIACDAKNHAELKSRRDDWFQSLIEFQGVNND